MRKSSRKPPKDASADAAKTNGSEEVQSDVKEKEAVKKPRGFAAMTPERRREIGSQGGKTAWDRGTANSFTPETAAEAAKKGGEAVSKDRQHMSKIGTVGGSKPKPRKTT